MVNNSEKKLENFEKQTFSIHKYLLTLAVTVFGSSVALATGKNINLLFIFGEFLIFISSVFGIFLLLSRLSVLEFDYILDLKLENTKSVELSKSCEKILKKNQSGILYLIFKKIKYERFFLIFVLTLIFGMFFIMLSLIHLNNKQIPYIFCF